MKQAAKRTVLASLALVVLLAAVLGGVTLAQAAAEQALLQNPHSRPLQAGELSPEAERNPLLAALWEKNQYYDPMKWLYSYEDMDEAPAPAQTFADAWLALGSAGVLPAQACQQAAEITGWWDDRHNAVLPGGLFTELGSLTVYRDALVVSAYVDVAEEDSAFSLEKALDAYIEYLGLAEFADWQPASIFHGSGVKVAERYSPTAQMLVQVLYDGRSNTYSCSIYAVPREEFAQHSVGK